MTIGDDLMNNVAKPSATKLVTPRVTEISVSKVTAIRAQPAAGRPDKATALI